MSDKRFGYCIYRLTDRATVYYCCIYRQSFRAAALYWFYCKAACL